mmetsp:Transcript_26836/g.40615  ORF Transcript_26836/g.40615 Transcript_26836/m.40615 type:complete len:100 (+) Transcript_26836:1698-1997(+)
MNYNNFYMIKYFEKNFFLYDLNSLKIESMKAGLLLLPLALGIIGITGASRLLTGGAGGEVTIPIRNGNKLDSKMSHCGISNSSSWKSIRPDSSLTVKFV